MEKRFFVLLLAFTACARTMLAGVKIGDLYYNLYATNQTAEVADQNENASGEIIIPSSVTYNSVSYIVTSIGNYAFADCSGLTSVTIGNSVTSIGKSAFYSCTSLTSVTIPNSVTSIGENAFDRCTGLTSVTIGNSVTSIGENAFAFCRRLTSIIVENGNTSFDSRNNCNAIIETATNTLIAGCKNTTIPNSVTSIGKFAFCWCTSLTSVTIPNSVTSIGEGAFNGCTGLTSVTIPNSVTSIGAFAFSGCSRLTSVTIPNSVTSIGDCAFQSCSGLTFPVYNAHVFAFMPTTYSGAYTIPDGIESIAGMAFRGCSGLTSVTIPNSVTSIGKKAFGWCTSLTSIDVVSDNSNYCSIDGVLFNKDETTLIQYPGGKQGSYTIPNSVTSIGESAFGGCRGLTSVTIPNSVTSIGDYAFDGCSGLTSVTNFANTPQEIDSYVFDDVDKSTCVLYVPAGSVSAYKSAEGWKDFTDILPISQQGFEDVQGNNLQCTKVYHDGQIFILRGEKVYTLQGQEVK